MINNIRNKALKDFLSSYVRNNYHELINDPDFIQGLKLSAETFNDNNNNFSIFDILPKTEESIDFLDNELEKIYHFIKKINHSNYIKTYSFKIGAFPNYYNEKENIFLSYNDALKSLQDQIKKLIDSDSNDSLHRYDFNISESNINKEQLTQYFSEGYLIKIYGNDWKNKLNI